MTTTRISDPRSAKAGSITWSRWRIETPAQFLDRVREDARRLGIRPIFDGEPYPVAAKDDGAA